MESKNILIAASVVLGGLSQVCAGIGFIFAVIFGVVIFAITLSILDAKEVDKKIMKIIILSGFFLGTGMLVHLIQYGFLSY